MLLVHSVVRWLVVLFGVVVIARLALGWAQRQPFGALDARLTRWFTALFDVQILVGVLFLVWSGLATSNWARYRLEHAFLMLIALGVVHLPMRWQSLDSPARHRNTLLAFTVSLALVGLGVMLLPGGWGRPFPPMFTLP